MTDVVTTTTSPQPPGNPHTFTSAARGSDLPMGSAVTASSSEDGVVAASGASLALSVAVGLTTRPAGQGDLVQVQYSGPITMTEDQWDQVTGGSGGLSQGATYYLGDGVVPGLVIEIRPTTPGHWICPMGFASSATTLIIQMSAPIQVA